jgi:hypothetical protein
VRRAKSHRGVPKRYYRPEQTKCPFCRQTLRRRYAVGRKYVVFLTSRLLVINLGYQCPTPRCAGQEQIYTSEAARRLTLRGSSFALEVIVQIGYWRFWQRWTAAQIHEVLTQERHLPISEREVLYLIGVFLVLLRCTYHLRLEEHATSFRRHGLFLSIDALKPEKGNTALYVVRELKFGLVLQVTPLLSADHQTLERRVLQPVKALGYHLRGVVSDDEQALRLAVGHVFSGVAHQTCQSHCLRDAAAPIVEADQAFKKALKRAIRAPFYTVCRALSQLSPTDPRHVVLNTYAELIRSTLTEGSKPPFALGGLRVFEDLTRLEASLTRSQKKGAIRSWINSWPWFAAAARFRRPIGVSSANGTGWSRWSDGLTRLTIANHAPRGATLSVRSRTFWPTWKSMPSTIPTKPPWSRISAPPSSNAGPGSLRATLGRNATGPTTIWKPSLVACAPASARFTAASRSTSSSFATESGLSLLIPPKPPSKCCTAFSNLTKPSLTRSTLGFSKPNADFKSYIVFAITPGVASNNWKNNGLRRFAGNLKKIPCR